MPRGSPRLGLTGGLVVAAMVVLILAGFGVLGGRPEASPEPTSVAEVPTERPAETPGTTPRVTPWADCGAASIEPPVIMLEVAGQPYPGDVEIIEYRVTHTPAPGPSAGATRGPSDVVPVPPDVNSEIWIDGGACAIAWNIDLVDIAVLDSVQNRNVDKAYASQNRFELELAPYEGNELVLRAVFVFETLVARATWPIRVGELEVPEPVLQAGRNTLLPLVDGCDVTMALGTGYQRRLYECPGDRIATDPEPPVAVAPGARLTFELPFFDIMGGQADCGHRDGTLFLAEPTSQCSGQFASNQLGVIHAPTDPGVWTLRISVCAGQFRTGVSNTVCGTYYTDLEVAE